MILVEAFDNVICIVLYPTKLNDNSIGSLSDLILNSPFKPETV